MSVNKATLLGRVGSDPTINEMSSGGKIVKVSIATSERWRDASGNNQEKTQWHQVVFFNALADIAAKILKKGDQAYIEGVIEYNKWFDAKINSDRYSTQIKASVLQRCASSQPNTSPSPPPNQQNTPLSPNSEPPAMDSFDDDIPF